MNRPLLRSAAFVRAARHYVKKRPETRDAIRNTLVRLESDAFDPALRSHKLKGDLAGCWACSAGYDLRIVFKLVDLDNAQAILLLSVGTHDQVY